MDAPLRVAHDRPATISDVAARAGVAASTVSRALSDPGRVAPHTRHRIEKAAADLNYVPSSHARALASGKTGVVAVLVPDITNPFYFDIIRGTQMQLKAAGYTQLLVDTEESAEVEAESLEKLRSSSDGFILAASRLNNAALAHAAASTNLVTINRGIAEIPSVFMDTPTAIAQALDHLVSLGHQNIAYISGPSNSWSNQKRWEAMEHRANELNVTSVKIGPFTPKTTSGAAAADSALNSGATACICFNDLIAIGMLQRFAERGVTVPDNFSVVGCDDIFGTDFCNPPLTTLTAPIEQAGRVAVSILLTRINPSGSGSQRGLTILPTHLTIRGSTGPARNPEKSPSSDSRASALP